MENHYLQFFYCLMSVVSYLAFVLLMFVPNQSFSSCLGKTVFVIVEFPRMYLY